MNWADVAVLAIIALSAVIGFFRGFLREVVGLASWVVAFYLAFVSAESAAVWFRRWIDSGSIRIAVAFAAVFIAVLVLGAIVNYILGRLVSKTGFAGTDRALGGAFGIIRGAAILVLLALLAGMTPLPKDAWWQDSVFINHLQDGAIRVRAWLPERFTNAIVYPTDGQVMRELPISGAAPDGDQDSSLASN